ncbi:MAG: CrcB family protein [Actinomycetia bacterium]|nr:CrcB family protein [Actinomycetes bacterium]MCP4962822.1 CrcB family protein [Actinomycetes bacterium]
MSRHSVLRAAPPVVLGAIVGAGLRWFVASIMASLGALVAVNAVGCVVIGVVAARRPTPRVSMFVATGFCGGLTTLSSVVLEIAESLADAELGRAVYVGAAVLSTSALGYVIGWNAAKTSTP